MTGVQETRTKQGARNVRTPCSQEKHKQITKVLPENGYTGISGKEGHPQKSKAEFDQKSWKPTRKKIHGKIDDLNNVDFLSSNAHSSHKEAMSTKQ